MTSMQTCDQTCAHCARDWWKWLRAREAQMSEPLTDKLARRQAIGSKDFYLKRGSGSAWSDEACTSVRPVRPAVGARVTVKTIHYAHTAVVLYNTGAAGGDGRHWVQIAVTARFTAVPHVWEVHFEAHQLVEAVTRGGIRPETDVFTSERTR